MPKIFISYRREDSKHAVGRLHAALKSHVKDPKQDIFMDIDNIPRGVDFVDHLDGQVAKCDIMLAVIGTTWLTATDPKSGDRRLDDPADFVRIEIAAALKRGIPVVPVVLDDTPVPRASDLPQDLQALARRNGERLEHESFDADVTRLIRNLPGPETPLAVRENQSATPSRVRFRPYRYVFVSYPKDIDQELMRSIVRTLIAKRIPVWLYDPAAFSFHKDELPSMQWQRAGMAWEAQTLEAISRARCVLALIGRSTLGSRFQERELELAAESGRIVTVIVDDLPFNQLPNAVQGLHAPRIRPEDANERVLAMLASDVAEQMKERLPRQEPAPTLPPPKTGPMELTISPLETGATASLTSRKRVIMVGVGACIVVVALVSWLLLANPFR